jgi:hypothetical protein
VDWDQSSSLPEFIQKPNILQRPTMRGESLKDRVSSADDEKSKVRPTKETPQGAGTMFGTQWWVSCLDTTLWRYGGLTDC